MSIRAIVIAAALVAAPAAAFAADTAPADHTGPIPYSELAAADAALNAPPAHKAAKHKHRAAHHTAKTTTKTTTAAAAK